MRSLPALRAAVPEDAACLAEFGARCFRDTYAPDNDPADMTAHLARTYSAEIQGRELRDPTIRYVLAEDAGEVVGFALLGQRPPPPEVRSTAPWEVRRFYVDHRWHGSGLSAALMREAVAIARHARDRALADRLGAERPRLRLLRQDGLQRRRHRDLHARVLAPGRPALRPRPRLAFRLRSRSRRGTRPRARRSGRCRPRRARARPGAPPTGSRPRRRGSP